VKRGLQKKFFAAFFFIQNLFLYLYHNLKLSTMYLHNYPTKDLIEMKGKEGMLETTYKEIENILESRNIKTQVK
jgi:NH3-dependent NAD+ synthetase